MLLVPCPNCGPRDAGDFRHSGESLSRPDTSSATPTEWRDYLFTRNNAADWRIETLYCRACRTWFSAERHTMTNEFRNPPVNVLETRGES